MVRRTISWIVGDSKMITHKVDFNYTGWELAPACLENIQELFCQKNLTKLDVLEFGSGKSTETMLKFISDNNIPGVYDVFDGVEEYKHPIAKLKPIVYYDKQVRWPINNVYYPYIFYELTPTDFNSDNYDLVIIDGHHGHGRSEAYNWMLGRVLPGCLVVIDDHDHYPFLDNFKFNFPNSKLICDGGVDKWIIFEITVQ